MARRAQGGGYVEVIVHKIYYQTLLPSTEGAASRVAMSL